MKKVLNTDNSDTLIQVFTLFKKRNNFGDYLIVGVLLTEFNRINGKKIYHFLRGENGDCEIIVPLMR